MTTEELITRLTGDAQPVTPISGTAARAARSVAVALGVALVFIIMAMALMPLDGAGASSPFFVQQAAALATFVAAVFAAHASVVPGSARVVRRAAGACGAVWLGVLVWGCYADVLRTGTLGLSTHTDWPCVMVMLTLGGVAWGSMLPPLRRGAVLTPGATAALAGVAAASLASLAACVVRPHEFTSVLLTWHGATFVMFVAAVRALGPRVLRWPSAARLR